MISEYSLFAACAALLLFVACDDLTSCVSDGGSAPTAKLKMTSTPFYCEQLEDHFSVDAQALVTALGSMKFVFTSATDENGVAMAKPGGMPETIELDGLKSCNIWIAPPHTDCESGVNFWFAPKGDFFSEADFTFGISKGSDGMKANDFSIFGWMFTATLFGGGTKTDASFSSIILYRDGRPDEKIVYEKL